VSLPEPATAFKALALEQGECGVVEKGTGDRSTLNLLRVAFDETAAELGDLIKGTFKRTRGDAPVAIVSINKKAGNPPVWKPGQTLLIGLLQLDAWEFVGWAELAPTNGGGIVVHKGGVCAARTDQTRLFDAVWRMWLRFPALYVKSHAPAPAPHAMVLFRQARKIGPRGLVKGLDGEGGGWSGPRFRGFAAEGRSEDWMWGLSGEARFGTH
jgi:hypothetical protein